VPSPHRFFKNSSSGGKILGVRGMEERRRRGGKNGREERGE
jgi:hypothetical protein